MDRDRVRLELVGAVRTGAALLAWYACTYLIRMADGGSRVVAGWLGMFGVSILVWGQPCPSPLGLFPRLLRFLAAGTPVHFVLRRVLDLSEAIALPATLVIGCVLVAAFDRPFAERVLEERRRRRSAG